MKQFSDQTQKFISDQTTIQQSNCNFYLSNKQDFQQYQFLDNIVKLPIQNIFDFLISEANQFEQEQNNNQVKEMVNQLLISISNNEEILGNLRQNVEDELFDDLLDDLEYREIQYQLFQKALNKNFILYQENHKIQIVLMLMWKQIQNFPNKKVIVLATTIPKADALAKYIKNMLPKLIETYIDDQVDLVKIQQFCSSLKIIHPNKCTDLWNDLLWLKILEDNNIYVMTGETFLNTLRRGYQKFTDFSMIYLDDCQVTIFETPYNHLFKEFYFPLKSSNQMPQIVGVFNIQYTNNKFINDEQILKELLQLCAYMDARFLNINTEIIKQNLREKNIIVSSYKQYLNDYKLHQKLESNIEINMFDSNLFDDQIKNNYLIELNEVKLILKKFKTKYQNYFSFKIMVKYFEQILLQEPLNLYLELGQYSFCLILNYIIEKLKNYISIMQLEPFYQELLVALEKSLTQTIQTTNQITPKFEHLYQLLIQTYKISQTKNNRILIYVKQQYIVYFFLRLLQDKQKLSTQDLKIGIIQKVRNDLDQKNAQNDISRFLQKIYQDLQQDQFKFSVKELKEQLIQLNDFFNLDQLTAQSNAVDELNQCQIVISCQIDENLALNFQKIIFFNLAPHSTYYSLMSKMKNLNNQIILMKVEKIEQRQNFYPNLINLQKVEKIIDECTIPQREIILQKAIDNLQNKALQNIYYESYTIQSSGAVLNTNWACNLIEYFSQQINQEKKGKTISKYAVYQLKNVDQKQNDQYISFLLLPSEVQSFIFYGKQTQGMKEAKASVAFESVLQLFQQGYFDCHLRSQIQNHLGQRIGINQEDPAVVMTEEQLNIYSKYCKTVNEKDMSILQGIITSYQYYYTFSKSLLFVDQQEINFIKQLCKFQNEIILLLYPEQFKSKLKQCKILIQMLDIYLGEDQIISQEDYLDYYRQYIHSIILEEELIQVDENIFSRMNQELKFKIKGDIEQNGLIIINNSKQFTTNYIINQFLLVLKASLFISNIQIQQIIKPNERERDGLNTLSNCILSNLNQYFNLINVLNQKGQVQESQHQQSIQRQKITIKSGILKDRLNKIILDSLNVSSYQSENLMLGKCYYKFLITIQILLNYSKSDFKIVEQKIKYFTSSTYIRNCLIESYLFLFLHKCDLVDISKGLIGFEKCDSNLDLLLEQSDLLNCNQKQREFKGMQNTVNFSNLDFKQFLQKSLQMIEQDDYQQKNGFDWIRTLKLTKILEKQIGSPQELQILIPCKVLNNGKLRQLKQSYNKFEDIIQYKFNSFELLFQAMTDFSFRVIINNEIQKQYMQKFQTKDEFQGLISEDELQQQKNQIDKMNSIVQSSYQNSHLAILGKSLWNYAVMKILNEKNLESLSFMTLSKILKGISFQSYAAIKLRIHSYLNSKNWKQLEDFAELNQKNKDQSITFHVSSLIYNENSAMLRNAFLALIGAIYIDSQFELSVIIGWIENLFNQIGVEQLLNTEFVKSRPRYRFYEWYKRKFGNPQYFDLIKIRHQDQKKASQGVNLYIPFDQQKGSIVNIKGQKFYEIGQLHIFGKCKSEAWDKLYELIEY